ncbi:hypothetical protein L292_3175 [Acinetobacter junii CIP 107470 = MTCC 11364]|uniref:SpoVT-AbrB domain-containing protein n=1 Tax=Acinetobacter junii CIP 107470 = MTCC 11364 TaxID=1217666 RepID=S7WRT1_ACIJU|nr:AbrB/MazE/SpoVT family DNA-binding domain-containing protein [Acinetobacter junii]ENV52028.1 hypothetical protein F953_00518 [Acinetobacter junii CIP 107470 = MTCC 11364]EPR85845.1 hypothetical protein L292_3175 [Acinetobacter junii CIP 107470 = MTCC 11364]
MKYISKIRKVGNGRYLSIPHEILESQNLESGSFLQLEFDQDTAILRPTYDDSSKIALRTIGRSIVMPIPMSLVRGWDLNLGQSLTLEEKEDGFLLTPVKYYFDIHTLLTEQELLNLEKNTVTQDAKQGDIVLCRGQYFVVLTSDQFNQQLQSLIAIPFENLNVSVPDDCKTYGFICCYKFRAYNVIRIDKPQSLPLDSIQVVDVVPEAIRDIAISKFRLVTHK